MTVVISTEAIVRWRKNQRTEKDGVGSSTFMANMMKAYNPSVKVSRGNSSKKKVNNPLLGNLQFDETLGLRVENNEESTLKSVIMALNKISPDNISKVLEDLKDYKPKDPKSLEMVSTIVYKKCLNENKFREQYFDILQNLWDWTADVDGFTWSVKDFFLVQLQRSFEAIDGVCKEEGCSIMKVLGCLYKRQWVPAEVFTAILGKFLRTKTPVTYEYAIVFLKSCPTFEKHQEVSELILSDPKLLIRLRMLLQG